MGSSSGAKPQGGMTLNYGAMDGGTNGQTPQSMYQTALSQLSPAMNARTMANYHSAGSRQRNTMRQWQAMQQQSPTNMVASALNSASTGSMAYRPEFMVKR